MSKPKTEARMLAEIMIELHTFFDSNMNKVESWLNCDNPNLGNSRPIDMIALWRIKRLHSFVMNSLESNYESKNT